MATTLRCTRFISKTNLQCFSSLLSPSVKSTANENTYTGTTSSVLTCYRPSLCRNDLSFTNLRNYSFLKLPNTIQDQSKNDATGKESEAEQDPVKDIDDDPVRAARLKWWKKIAAGTFIGLFSGSCVYFVYLCGLETYDEDYKKVDDGFGQGFSAARSYNKIKSSIVSIKEPSRAKLLPDPLKYPYMQPPYTLAIEITGVLVHPEWTYDSGWRFKKRPGLDVFLQKVAPPMFEVVIYTSEGGMNLDPVVTALDPQGIIMYRLYRDATKWMKNHHVKDLSCLNRDLSKVIMVDWSKNSTELQPDNAITLKKWTGDPTDRDLIDLANFLQVIATSNVEDVRSVLEHYKQFDDPLEAFRENQRLLREQQEQIRKMKEEQQKSGPLSGYSGKIGRKLFG